MKVIGQETGYAYADLYPGWGVIDTSTVAVPETDDQDALNENVIVAENSDMKNASKKNIMIALVVLVALIIFFGG